MNAGASASAIVVGAGIVGASCALYLARAGFAVTVLDAAFPASGATAAGMGHLVTMDDSDSQFALTSYSQGLWREVREEFGAFAEMDNCGTLWIAEDEEEMAAVLQKHSYYSSRGVAAEVLDPHQVASCEPLLRRPLAGALRVPGDSVVYPPAAALAFLDAARRSGARMIPNWRATRIASGLVSGDSGTVAGDVIVNATGNDAGLFSAECELRPRRGHLVITERYPGAVRHQIVELGYLRSAHGFSGDSVAFNVQPRATGQMLIGSSRELGARSSAINEVILDRMLVRARHFMPSLPRLVATRVWTGMRPTSADKLPFIGPSMSAEGVWVAAGHEGLGITTSLGTGKLLAAMITGAAPAIDVNPFRPGRKSAAWT